MFYICAKNAGAIWQTINDDDALALIEQYRSKPYTFLKQLKNNQNISFDLSDVLYIKWVEGQTTF